MLEFEAAVDVDVGVGGGVAVEVGGGVEGDALKFDVRVFAVDLVCLMFTLWLEPVITRSRRCRWR